MIRVFVTNPPTSHTNVRVAATAWRRFTGKRDFSQVRPEEARTLSLGSDTRFDLNPGPGLWTVGIVYTVLGPKGWGPMQYKQQSAVQGPFFFKDQDVKFDVP